MTYVQRKGLFSIILTGASLIGSFNLRNAMGEEPMTKQTFKEYVYSLTPNESSDSLVERIDGYLSKKEMEHMNDNDLWREDDELGLTIQKQIDILNTKREDLRMELASTYDGKNLEEQIVRDLSDTERELSDLIQKSIEISFESREIRERSWQEYVKGWFMDLSELYPNVPVHTYKGAYEVQRFLDSNSQDNVAEGYFGQSTSLFGSDVNLARLAIEICGEAVFDDEGLENALSMYKRRISQAYYRKFSHEKDKENRRNLEAASKIGNVLNMNSEERDAVVYSIFFPYKYPLEAARENLLTSRLISSRLGESQLGLDFRSAVDRAFFPFLYEQTSTGDLFSEILSRRDIGDEEKNQIRELESVYRRDLDTRQEVFRKRYKDFINSDALRKYGEDFLEVMIDAISAGPRASEHPLPPPHLTLFNDTLTSNEEAQYFRYQRLIDGIIGQ